MAMKIREQKWKKDLGSILEDLKNDEYRKLLSLLDMIPAEKKGKTDLPEMPQLIIQTCGLERSITVIKKAMDDIPRKDGSIQNRLVPYVNKLKEIKQAKKNERIGAGAGNKPKTSAKPSGLKRKLMSPQDKMLSGGPKAKKKKTEKKNPSVTRTSSAPKTAPSGQQKLKPKTQKKPRPPKPAGSTKTQSVKVKNKPTDSDRPKKKMAKKKSESHISSLFSVWPQVPTNSFMWQMG